MSRFGFSVCWHWHVVFLGVALSLATMFVGTDSFVYIDEAALLAQATLVESGTWTAPLVDTGAMPSVAPMARSTLTGTDFAPFPNHPAHVYLAAAALDLGGIPALRVVSVVAVVLAAAIVGSIAARQSRESAVIAVWVTGAASPLFFDAQLLVAHAIGAALVAGAIWVLCTPATTRSPRLELGRLAGLVTLAGLGVLLRSEVVLLVAALVAVSGVMALATSRIRVAVDAVACGTGALAAYLIEPIWIRRLVDAPVGAKSIQASPAGRIPDILDSVRIAVVGVPLPTGRLFVLGSGLLIASGIGMVVAPHRRRPVLVAAWLAVALLMSSLVDPVVVAGIGLAMPVLAIGLVASGRFGLASPTHRGAAAVGVVFVMLVAGTQYANAGGFEWGWRYVAVALPLLALVIAEPLERARTAIVAVDNQVAVAAIVVGLGATAAVGMVAQRDLVSATSSLEQAVDAEVRSGRTDVIIAIDPSFGRFMWRYSIDQKLVTATRDSADAIIEALVQSGRSRILLVTPTEELDPVVDVQSQSSSTRLGASSYFATHLEPAD